MYLYTILNSSVVWLLLFLKNAFVRNNTNPPTEEFNVMYTYTCDRAHSNSAQTHYIICYVLWQRSKKKWSNISAMAKAPRCCLILYVIAKINNKQNLIIMETLLIKHESLIINTQCNDFHSTLKILQWRKFLNSYSLCWPSIIPCFRLHYYVILQYRKMLISWNSIYTFDLSMTLSTCPSVFSFKCYCYRNSFTIEI